jgi:hypothetical protein
MSDTKISALTAASVAAGANELAINEAGASKKITVTQVNTYLLSINNIKPNENTQTTSFTVPANYSFVQPRMHKINSGVILSLGSGAIFRIL